MHSSFNHDRISGPRFGDIHKLNTVELGNKELFGHPKIVPYPYEVNGKLVTGNGSFIPICSLSNRSLLPSLTVRTKKIKKMYGGCFNPS